MNNKEVYDKKEIISEEIKDATKDMVEIILDNFFSKDEILDKLSLGKIIFENENFKSLPVVKTALGVGETVKNIYEWNLIKQLKQFLNEFNKQNISEEQLKKYKERVYKNFKTEKKEISRILMILNETKEDLKAKLLAKFFAAYLNMKISSDKFWEYSEVINRMFINDLDIVFEIYSNKNVIEYEKYRVDRLIAVGILSMYDGPTTVKEISGSGKRETFQKNDFGTLFYEIASKK